MTFILAAQRDRDAVAAFNNYTAYLRDNERRFPASAYALTTSDWYFDFNDHRCPHDAWLEAAAFAELASGSRSEVRTSTLSIRLLGAYHDGYIELIYPEVYAYHFEMPYSKQGHGEWRYDEFRVDERGRVLHEIEWAMPGHEGRWLITASDVHYRWTAKA